MPLIYKVELASKRVEKQILGFPRKDGSRITKAILNLGKTPRPYGAKKLAADVYRIRIGRYRIIYEPRLCSKKPRDSTRLSQDIQNKAPYRN